MAELKLTDLPAPLWRRLAALAYDLIAVLAIVMVVGLICQVATGGTLIVTSRQVRIPAWYQALQGAVVAGYFLASWRYGGQTLGLRAWKLRLADHAGRGPAWRALLLRLVVGAAPLLMLPLAPLLGVRAELWLLAALWALWFGAALADPRRRALHDRAAGTELRRLE